MSTVDTVVAGPAGAGVVPLTAREALRLARHPLLWLVPAIVVPAAGAEALSAGRTAAFWHNTIYSVATFLGPMLVLFVANMLASSARRVRAEEMLGVAPMTDTARTLALCLGVALGLGAAGAVAAVAMSLLDKGATVPIDGALTEGELAQLPPILAGAGLLGVLSARWLRFPGAALMTFVVFVLGGTSLFSRFDTGTWWYWWSTATTLGDRAEVSGNPWWHAVYLAGLCACATVAAVFRDRTEWTKLVLLGVPVLAVTLGVGWLQLP